MQQLIDKYGLKPHPEGGYYREVHRSRENVNAPAHGHTRAACTHIYFLLVAGQFSRFHRLTHDEIWNVYEGAPVRLIRYDGTQVRDDRIGSGCAAPFLVVAGGEYMAAESTGTYTLMGCTVAPGFEFEDFTFLRDNAPVRERLEATFPSFVKFV